MIRLGPFMTTNIVLPNFECNGKRMGNSIFVYVMHSSVARKALSRFNSLTELKE